MPELPEVETLRRQLIPAVCGATILSTTSAHPRFSLAGAEHREILSLDRRGKYLIARLSGSLDLVVHLGMTGQLHFRTRPPDHVVAEIVTDRGVLYLRDPRRFGRAAVLPSGEYGSIPTLAALGPEPLDADFDLAAAAHRLARGTAPVKARLLAQHAFAGAGNYICDEALHRAGVHPATRDVPVEIAAAIVSAAVEVARVSLELQGLSARDYQHLDGGRGSSADVLVCYGRAGQPCTRCGHTLEKTRVAGRGSTFCPVCQPAPNP